MCKLIKLLIKSAKEIRLLFAELSVTATARQQSFTAVASSASKSYQLSPQPFTVP